MAYPVIRINNVTGSDTQASGAGPDPAIYGMQAATDSAGTTVDLSLDNPDLSGVATDGSHVIWLGGTGGIEFEIITGVDNTAKTVTVANAFPASLSGLQWAIGGKRASLGATVANSLWTAVKGKPGLKYYGVICEVEYTGQDYEANQIAAEPRLWIRGVGGRPRIVVPSGASYAFSTTKFSERYFLSVFENLEFTHADYLATGTRTGNPIEAAYYRPYTAINCVAVGMGGWSCHQLDVREEETLLLWCEARDCNSGIASSYGVVDAWFCRFSGCDVGISPGNRGIIRAIGCIIDNCTTGARSVSRGILKLINCTFVDISGNAIETSSDYEVEDVLIAGSVFYSIGGYVFNGRFSTVGGEGNRATRVFRPSFAYGAATSGLTNSQQAFPSLPSDIVLTEDPFVDRVNGNYALNDAPGGGKLLKDAGWPQTWPGLPNTTSYPDIGAVESQAGAGSSSGPPILIPRPVRRGWI